MIAGESGNLGRVVRKKSTGRRAWDDRDSGPNYMVYSRAAPASSVGQRL
jgi:hypothetical protein